MRPLLPSLMSMVFVASLFAFNVRVEIGQLTVIAICFLAVGIWLGKTDWYRPRNVHPASLATGGYSFAWFIERSLEIELPILAVVALTVVIGAILLAKKGRSEEPTGEPQSPPQTTNP